MMTWRFASRAFPWAGAALLLSLVPSPAVGQGGPDVRRELAVAQATLRTPQMQAAMEYLRASRDETIQEWLSVCNAYGPSGQEGNRSRLLYKLFRIYGLEDVRIDDALNVIGVRRGRGGGPTIVLNAHHDNVSLWPASQPVEAFVADGRVWCPAAFDDLSGVTQMLGVLRAMNAAGIETRGDVWFVGLTGEEAPHGPDHPDASPGMEQLVRAHYPHVLDWRRGDIIVQLHGRGGGGVSTGSVPLRHRSQLRVFAPFDGNRWVPHAVDALARIVVRLGQEVRDPRASGATFPWPMRVDSSAPVLYMNMAMIQASEIIARPASEAWVRFDLRSEHESRIEDAHQRIRAIAAEEVAKMGSGFSFVYEINSKNGLEGGLPGWNAADNAPARMAAAAAQVLYGGTAVIDAEDGCGDCVRAYRTGMPAMSLRGDVTDDLGVSWPRTPAPHPVRRRTATHDVTESAAIVGLWPGMKHGLLFVAAYAGMVNEAGTRR